MKIKKFLSGFLSVVMVFSSALPVIADAPLFWPADREFVLNDGSSPDGRATLADFDGDGDLDMVLQYDDGYLKFLENPGDGTYRLAGKAESGGYRITAADFDGDGDIDLAAAGRWWGTTNVLLNQGKWQFADAGAYPGGDDIQSKDLDGDGDVDLVVSGLTVLLNDGAAVFTAVPYGANGSSFVLSDLDGDGDPDIATSGNYYGAVEGDILINNGSGNFTAIGKTGTVGGIISAGDFDGDRDIDLAVVTNEVVSCSWWWCETRDVVVISLNNGDGTFARGGDAEIPKIPDAWNPRIQDMISGDFNGDGLTDLALYDDYCAVVILKANGDGTFSASVQNYFGCDNAVLSAGDVDADGDIDLVMVDDSGCGDLGVLKNNGDGTFAGAPRYLLTDTRWEISSVALGDLNGDGRADMAVGRDSGTVQLLLNGGNRTFTPGPQFPVTNAVDIVVADFDNDGDMDIATTGVDVLLNDGRGNFAPAGTYEVASVYMRSGAKIQAADMDGDGDKDLITSNSEILKNDGTGHFGEAVAYPGVSMEVVADFNGDGYPDVAGGSSRWGDSPLTVVFNDGRDGFDNAITYTVPSRFLTATDVDNDGDIDIAAAAANDRRGTDLAILKNDGRGGFRIDGSYTVILGGHSEPNGITAADFNQDGYVDFAFTNCYHTIPIALNNGDGTFRVGGFYSGVCGGVEQQIESGDVDGDGAADIITVEDYSLSAVHILFNDTVPVFKIRELVEKLISDIEILKKEVVCGSVSGVQKDLDALATMVLAAASAGGLDRALSQAMLAKVNAATDSATRAAEWACKGKIVPAVNMLGTCENQLGALLNVLTAAEMSR